MKEIYSFDEIIDGCLKNDRKAQHRLYEAFSGSMYVLCLRYAKSKEEAEDILIDGFTNVFSHLQDFHRNSSLKTWIHRIFVNSALDSIRANRKYRFVESFDESEAEIEQNPMDGDIITKLEAKQILHLMNEMPDDYRIIFNLRVFEECSFKEIAEELGRKEDTVRMYFRRARLWLIKAIENEEKVGEGN